MPTSKDWIESQNPECGPDIVRSYERDVTTKIESLISFYENSNIDKRVLTKSGGYPLLYLKIGSGPKQVLVTGGVHGDEPAGTHAAVELIGKAEQIPSNFTLHLFPCMNPWGYEHNRRENGENIDLNRSLKPPYKISSVEGCESLAFINLLDQLNLKLEFAVDFHEGSRNKIWKNFSVEQNPNGAWLYETCQKKELRLGRKMIESVRNSDLPVNTLKKVYGEDCVEGLVSYPEALISQEYANHDSYDAFLESKYATRSYTSETNMDWPLEDRIKAHHLMFFAALKQISK